MSDAKIRHDATASTRGTIYHICVAVAKCYELKESQKLLIEELGDVTMGDQQIEVKQYSDSLTDGHHNFWNTLKNWSDDGYDHTPYTSLILHTTQEFGAEATIAKWNDVDSDKRLELLLAINKKFETTYVKAKTTDHPKHAPSAVLKLQRSVLDTKRQAKLKDIVGKVWIEAKAKGLPDLYEELKQNRIRGTLSGKKDDYLNSLIGFVCLADKKAGDQWEISYEMFEAKLGDLNAIYSNETRRFPRKHFTHRGTEVGSAARDDIFVRKIKDIDYSEMICSAIHDYEATIATLDQEFRMYAVDPSAVEGYCHEIEAWFLSDYRIACRKCADEVADSKDLFDRITGSPASSLPGFGDTPVGFRNGLLHQRMNSPAAPLKWRVSKK